MTREEALDVIRDYIKGVKDWGVMGYDMGEPIYATDSQQEFELWEDVLEALDPPFSYDED